MQYPFTQEELEIIFLHLSDTKKKLCKKFEKNRNQIIAIQSVINKINKNFGNEFDEDVNLRKLLEK